MNFEFHIFSLLGLTIFLFQNHFTFHCFGHTKIHGFVTWFSVDFLGSVTLTTSPYEE